MEQEPHCPPGLQLRRRVRAGRSNRCYRAVLQRGGDAHSEHEQVFAKFSDNQQEGLLPTEAQMLQLLARYVHVPRVVLVTDHCLVLPLLRLDNSNKHIPQLAREVGTLHSSTRSDQCGFHVNNFHGPLAVDNSWESNWVTFFKNSRWLVLCEELERRGGFEETLKLAKEVGEKMDVFFPSEPYLCLLHGDLHHSNWGFAESEDGEGHVYLFDPLPLYGHNELDLASLDCFVQPKESFLNEYYLHVPKENNMFEERRMLYHSFFRIIGHLLTGEPDHLRRADEYLVALRACCY